MTNKPPFRDYLAQTVSRRTPAGGDPAAPRPGHGRVFMNQARDGTWTASWDDEERNSFFSGAREEVVHWARGTTAKEILIFSSEKNIFERWTGAWE